MNVHSSTHHRPMAPLSPVARPGAPRLASYSHQSNDSDDKDSLGVPKRAQTFQNDSPANAQQNENPVLSAFEVEEESDPEDAVEATRASIELDVLPIELISLTDSFIDSLSAKVHRTPPSIDRLSQLFQDFYAQASGNIDTHIQLLATRRGRDGSPAASSSSISSAASRLRNKASSLSIAKDKPKTETEQQMITAEELAGRKQMRKALEVKRRMLEEAVERRLCEGIYDRIYRHTSTQDEALDDKLRSKTAALALVGIGPADLGVDLGDLPDKTPEATAKKTEDIRKSLAKARADLARMHQSRYPLGKINHLKAAHRSIVDTIASFHPSASADEIMPMLIFTLITLPPEDLHVISDIRFIQSFRWEPKLTGEAAYCITNLEATISFLQTVDLATLRSDEQPEGPPKAPSQTGTPRAETFPPAYSQGDTAAASAETTKDSLAPTKTNTERKYSNPLRNRRLSDLVNTPAQAFGAASDAVFATADQGLKTVSTSLGESYKFLLGKLRENQDNTPESITVPRTLADARKLVSTPSTEEEKELDVPVVAEETKGSAAREDRVLNLIGGRRDRSADSTAGGRSASSSRPGLTPQQQPAARGTPSPQPSGSGQNTAMLDQMRNHLSTSFNPVARLSNQFGMMRSFGRNASQSQTPAATATSTAAASNDTNIDKAADGGDLATAFPDIAAALPPKTTPTPKIAPPNKRFMEMQNPSDLKIGEVLELLRDYRRLAGALNKMDAFSK
ncbi:Vacuolar sorting protein 9 (VPS9) domain [Geosmithia morbida]|uniref:Vacuolar sorting protein 9 (VPS9) domain n=1 Tax=Geosmithia morbida TaxID=1094350 RepID=A0A9P4YR67_9HYPO|nr:Vacuolar sorting protein 9 (VPS9) domain [Geosmithia morbida]KAF4121260.1 Vacuolar sorting protein 9 (VPS9) domain [Geosmithia morbida]